MMWEVLSFGDKPYGEMSNQEVSPEYSSSSHLQLTPLIPSQGPPMAFSCKCLYLLMTLGFSVLLAPLVLYLMPCSLYSSHPDPPTVILPSWPSHLLPSCLKSPLQLSCMTLGFSWASRLACYSRASSCPAVQVMKSIEDGYRLPPPVDCPAPLYELMKNCWAYDRARRPHFQKLQAHLEQVLANPHSLRTIANFDPR